ncbi:uncharacterized protein LOC124817823 [Hydra vulgaris]|uniref:uncharacterized protein LOC124817823 n=1 Tax=Hydra vulgaris TaxID=6087 RepID=UPI0032EA20B2
MEGSLNIGKLYDLFKVYCDENGYTPVKEHMNRYIFNHEFNIEFQKPKKDLCDICYEYCNIVNASNEQTESYNKPITSKNDTKTEREKDCQNVDPKTAIVCHSSIQECDNIHSQIEKSLSAAEIFSPLGLERAIKNVNRKKPFSVYQMQLVDVKNFSIVAGLSSYNPTNNSNKEISVYLFNARSLANKLHEFNLYTEVVNPALICVCETFFNNKLTNGIVCPNGYSIYRKDRVKIGGGVAIYCRHDIKSKQVAITQNNNDVDIICVDILKLRLITCYRPPSYSKIDFDYLVSMMSIINDLCDSVSQFIIVGDFNLPKIDWLNYISPNEKCHSLFLTLVNSLGMHQFVHEPTRESNILDLVFSNNNGLLSKISVKCPFSTSDHNSVHFSLNINDKYQYEKKSKYFYDFINADIDNFLIYLSNINWDYEFSYVFNIDEYWNIFYNHMRIGIDRFVPVRKIHHNKKSHHYPKYIKKMLSRKLFLWKRNSVNKTILHKQTYKTYAIKCVQTLFVYPKRIELKLVDDHKHSKFFNYVNNKLNNHKGNYPIKNNDNNFKLNSCNKETAEVFNKHFGSVFTDGNNYSPNITSFVNDSINIEDINFSVQTVYSILINLKPSTSYGPDGIPNILLKKLALVLCIPLSFIFDASFKSTTTVALSFKSTTALSLPQQWLQAFVSLIFKKGATSDPNNYRPISLTCTCCRAIERIINSDIIKHLTLHNLIANNQHGFLKKRSTCTNLLESVNDWSTALDNNLTTDVVYIAFQKVFDSVSHPKLLAKLALFNIRVNYLDCSLELYADDIKLYSSFCNTDHSHYLAIALNNVVLWSETWPLPISTSKCFVHKIAPASSRKLVNFNYKLGDHILAWSSIPKDLGVTLDSQLNYKKHISNIVHAANTRAFLILKRFKSRDSIILVKAFNTYIRPILEYCSPVWSPYHVELIKVVENVQKRFTKKILHLGNLTYDNRIQLLDLESLELRCFHPPFESIRYCRS